MNQTSPSSPAADPQFAAFIGLDWADQKHAWALQEAGSQRVEQGTVDNTPEAMDAWVTELTSRFHSQPIAVAVEPVRGSVIAKLSKYAHVMLYPIHPKASSDYRSAFRPSGAKSDPSDAALLLEMVTRHRDRLRKLDPDTEPTRMLRILVERRRDLVDQQTAYTNQLTAVLKQIFPQALDWLDKLNTPLACDFLERWPTLESLRKVPTNPAGFLSKAQQPQQRAHRTTHPADPSGRVGHRGSGFDRTRDSMDPICVQATGPGEPSHCGIRRQD